VLGCVVAPLLGAVVLRRWRPRPGTASRLSRVLEQLLDTAELCARRPGVVLRGLLLSMTMHAVAMGYFTLLTGAIGGAAADYGLVATVFPLGLLTVALPISPAGMGVGHVAFDGLYAVVGLTGGATVFNVYLIGQIVPCVLGVIPYLMLRRSRPGVAPDA
jgi:glycosyltransferase 2 family protein